MKRRSQKFTLTHNIILPALLLLVSALVASAQDPAGFVAEIGDGVSAVERAPCTLTVRAVDADGQPLADFSWAGVGFSGLETSAGNQIKEVSGLLPFAEGRTSVAVEEGALVFRSVVLHGPVVVLHNDRNFTVIERSIFSWAAILPPLLAIILAIITRQVLVALLAGVWAGMWSVTGGPLDGFFVTITESVPGALDPSRIKILVFSCLLGSVVALVARMGGTQALVALMTRFGKSPRGAQLTTWFAGIFVFFDDYANALLVGNTMRPVTDRFRVSREKLSFLVDATSAPVACVFIISTWIAAEIGYIEGKLGTPAVQAATGYEAKEAYQVFLSTVPYNFYPFLCLFFGLMVCLLGRDFGPMLRAERRARKEGKLLADGAMPLSSKEMDELVPADPSHLRWYNAVGPIGIVILSVIVSLYVSGRDAFPNDASPALREIFGAADSYNALLLSSFLGVIVAGVMALSQRLMNLREVVDVATAGIKAMMPAALVLILAWSLQGVCEKLNTSQFLIYHVSFTLSFLPAAVFVLSAVVGFSTGTSWGTMGILVPLTIDYACGMAVDQSLTQPEVQAVLASSVGAVLAGAVFGDHCSPISDTTIMSSMASGADHVDHVRTQLPYAVTVAVLALLLGYLPAGFGVSPLILLPLGLTAVALAVRFLGKKTDEDLLSG